MQDESAFLSFCTSGEVCALPLADVQEIVEYHAITRVPGAPKFVLGVFNLRGNVVPVIDLASRLGLSPRPIDKRACLIVLKAFEQEEDTVVAVLVDSVEQVLEPGDIELEPVPTLGTRIAPELLTGVFHGSERRLVQLLSTDEVLRPRTGKGAQR